MTTDSSTTMARLNSAKAKLEAAKTEKARAEATVENLTKQLADIDLELAALGVTPDQLEAEIARLDAEVEEKLTQAEQLLGAMAPPAGGATTGSLQFGR